MTAVKLCLGYWKALLAVPATVISSYAAPFLFHFFLPGFKGPMFPVILVFYITFGQAISLTAQGPERVSRLLLPVTAPQVVLSLFLYHLSIMLSGVIIAYVFSFFAMKEALASGIIEKALGITLLFGGLTTTLLSRVPAKVHQLISMLALMMTIVLSVSDVNQAFLPWLNTGLALLIGGVAFVAMLVFSLRFPPRALKEV